MSSSTFAVTTEVLANATAQGEPKYGMRNLRQHCRLSDPDPTAGMT
jgi:hypothetical protein